MSLLLIGPEFLEVDGRVAEGAKAEGESFDFGFNHLVLARFACVVFFGEDGPAGSNADAEVDAATLAVGLAWI
jgi:hypothetical protein